MIYNPRSFTKKPDKDSSNVWGWRRRAQKRGTNWFVSLRTGFEQCLLVKVTPVPFFCFRGGWPDQSAKIQFDVLQDKLTLHFMISYDIFRYETSLICNRCTINCLGGVSHACMGLRRDIHEGKPDLIRGENFWGWEHCDASIQRMDSWSGKWVGVCARRPWGGAVPQRTGHWCGFSSTQQFHFELHHQHSDRMAHEFCVLYRAPEPCQPTRREEGCVWDMPDMWLTNHTLACHMVPSNLPGALLSFILDLGNGVKF